jgi:hypothetical protein
MGEIITLDDVSVPGKKAVDLEKLKEKIPGFEKFDEHAQNAVQQALSSGARVMTTTVETIHQERDRAQAGRILSGHDGFVKGEHAVAMVVDWGPSTNGAYVFLNDPKGKYGVTFDNEGFSVGNKGAEPLSGQRFFYSENGIVARKPAEEMRRTALIQDVRSNNPQGADVDLSNYAKTNDNPGASSLHLAVAPGTNVKFGPDTYGVSVYVHADEHADLGNHTRIIGHPANFKGATAEMGDGTFRLSLGNRTQGSPVGNTTVTFAGIGKNEFGQAMHEPASAYAVITAPGAKAPAIVSVVPGGEPRLGATPAQIQGDLQRASADAEVAGKAAGASISR